MTALKLSCVWCQVTVTGHASCLWPVTHQPVCGPSALQNTIHEQKYTLNMTEEEDISGGEKTVYINCNIKPTEIVKTKSDKILEINVFFSDNHFVYSVLILILIRV